MSIEVIEERSEHGLRFSTVPIAGVELELVDVPLELRVEAHQLITLVAQVVGAQAGALARELIVARAGTCVVAVRARARGPAPSPGVLARLLGRPERQLYRLCSADPGAEADALPRTALESMLIEEAVRTLSEGDPRGLEMLRSSARRFPGVPNTREHGYGPDYDLENALAHLQLALLEPDVADGAGHYDAALERSAVLSVFELGGRLPSFRAMSFQHVAELTRFVSYQTLRTEPIIERISPRLALMRSPIWYLDARSGKVARGSGPWPTAFLDLYFRGEPARVLSTPFATDTVVSAMSRHKRQPALLAARALSVIRLWREVPEAPLEPTPLPFVTPARFLSLLLAAIGVGVAAGLSEDEIRVWLGASEGNAESALGKLGALERQIAGWMRDAAS